MKSILLLAGTLILALSSCRPEVPSSGRQIDFGIYETLDPVELRASIIQRLQELQVQVPDTPRDPFAGYTDQNGQACLGALAAVGADEGIRVAVTAEPATGQNGSYGVVALREPAVIGPSDIREAKAETDRVILRMTLQGANKWADMTERNTGSQVAFLLDGLIYNLPFVAAPIRSGEALITGLDAAEAGRIANLLNGETGP